MTDPLVDWQVETLRLTVFAKESFTIDTGSWERITGVPPDSVTSQPKKGILKESGEYKEAVLTLSTKQDRIDWIIGVLRRQDDDDEEPKISIGDFATNCAEFENLMQSWLSSIGSIALLNRIAFGAVLILPVSDRDEAHELLSRFLPLTIDKGVRNFFYQINRRRESKAGIPINRLSKWSCAEYTTAQLTYKPELESAVVRNIGEDKVAAQLELDINTVPEYDIGIRPSEAVEIFRELVEFGTEISQKGDIS